MRNYLTAVQVESFARLYWGPHFGMMRRPSTTGLRRNAHLQQHSRDICAYSLVHTCMQTQRPSSPALCPWRAVLPSHSPITKLSVTFHAVGPRSRNRWFKIGVPNKDCARLGSLNSVDERLGVLSGYPFYMGFPKPKGRVLEMIIIIFWVLFLNPVCMQTFISPLVASSQVAEASPPPVATPAEPEPAIPEKEETGGSAEDA